MGDRITREELKKELNKIIGESQTKLKDRYDHAREQVKDKYDHAREEIRDRREKADKYVSENPEKSMAAGAGIGFLIGIVVAWLFSRKNKD